MKPVLPRPFALALGGAVLAFTAGPAVAAVPDTAQAGVSDPSVFDWE